MACSNCDYTRLVYHMRVYSVNKKLESNRKNTDRPSKTEDGALGRFIEAAPSLVYLRFTNGSPDLPRGSLRCLPGCEGKVFCSADIGIGNDAPESEDALRE